MAKHPEWSRSRLWSALSVGAALGVAAATAGCGGKKTPSAAAQVRSPAVIKDVGAKPTEAEAKKFAEDLIAAVETDDFPSFERVVDCGAMLDLAAHGVDVPADWMRGFRTGFLKSVNRPGGLFERLASIPKSGGSFTLLQVRGLDDRPSALIRVIDDTLNVDYFDFKLARGPDGKVRAVDFYEVQTGENFSKTLRGMFLPLAADKSRNVIQKLLSQESEMVKALPKIKRMADAIRENKATDALAAFDSLPPGVKKEKTIMLLRLHAAQLAENDTLYLRVTDELASSFPNDPCVDVNSINACSIRKEYDKALAALGRLEKQVAGDPYLNVLRASFLLEQGKHDDAAQAVQKAVDAEPTLQPAHVSRFEIANMRKKYADMVRFLGEYEKTFDEKLGEFETEPDFAGFVASAEYKEYEKKSKAE